MWVLLDSGPGVHSNLEYNAEVEPEETKHVVKGLSCSTEREVPTSIAHPTVAFNSQ